MKSENVKYAIVNVNWLKGFATYWEFSFHSQKKVTDYEWSSLFAK